MNNCRITFEVYEGDITELQGYQESTGDLVFDVKLGENFRLKASYCANDFKVGAPESVTSGTVVSMDSVRTILMKSALNGLDVL